MRLRISCLVLVAMVAPRSLVAQSAADRELAKALRASLVCETINPPPNMMTECTFALEGLRMVLALGNVGANIVNRIDVMRIGPPWSLSISPLSNCVNLMDQSTMAMANVSLRTGKVYPGSYETVLDCEKSE